jgi:DMSO/TMAO reductase YedYZ molybdopterin-dependent catalytic subunit
MNPDKARTLFGGKYIEDPNDIPALSIDDWTLDIEGLSSSFTITIDDLRLHEMKDLALQFECEWCDKIRHIYTGVDFTEFLNDEFMIQSGDAIGIEMLCRDGYENFLSNDQIFSKRLFLVSKKNGCPIEHLKGGPVRGVFQNAKGRYSPRYLCKIRFVTNSRHDPQDPRYLKV